VCAQALGIDNSRSGQSVVTHHCIPLPFLSFFSFLFSSVFSAPCTCRDHREHHQQGWNLLPEVMLVPHRAPSRSTEQQRLLADKRFDYLTVLSMAESARAYENIANQFLHAFSTISRAVHGASRHNQSSELARTGRSGSCTPHDQCRVLLAVKRNLFWSRAAHL